MVHSYGLILAMMNSSTDTPQYAVITHSQTKELNGARNENRLGELFVDFLYSMLMPAQRTIVLRIRYKYTRPTRYTGP